MKSSEMIQCLESIREIINWNSVPDIDFSDDHREAIVIDIDDIIERIKNPYDED